MSVLTIALGGLVLGILYQIIFIRVLSWVIIPAIILGIVVFFLLYVLYIYIVFFFTRNNYKSKKMRHLMSITSQLANDFMGIKLTKIFETTMPKDEGFLLIGNHQSALDVVSVFEALEDYNLFAVGKESLYHFPVVRPAFDNTRSVRIVRDNPRQSFKAIKQAEQYIKEGQPLLIYPEGTRTKDANGKMNDFKPGVFKIVKNCKIDMYFVITYGNYKKNPYFWSFKHKNITQKYIGPIKYEEVQDMTTTEMSEYVQNIFEEELIKGL